MNPLHTYAPRSFHHAVVPLPEGFAIGYREGQGEHEKLLLLCSPNINSTYAPHLHTDRADVLLPVAASHRGYAEGKGEGELLLCSPNIYSARRAA
jgi:hypothetical protein